MIALDPATGAERWAYDPKIDLSGRYANQLVCRGVTHWRDESAVTGAACQRTISTATNDARLIALDAATGQPCPAFGLQVQLDLNEAAGEQK